MVRQERGQEGHAKTELKIGKDTQVARSAKSERQQEMVPVTQ